jgi:anti-sigma28 factor (negative regulator of flagellin synthesis)
MAIVEVTSGATPLDPLKGKKGDPSSKTESRRDESTDRVEVSEEARALFDVEQTRRFEVIREKIRQGFYFQPDVTEKVVESLLKDLKTSS